MRSHGKLQHAPIQVEEREMRYFAINFLSHWFLEICFWSNVKCQPSDLKTAVVIIEIEVKIMWYNLTQLSLAFPGRNLIVLMTKSNPKDYVTGFMHV